MNNFKICDLNKNDLETISQLFDDYGFLGKINKNTHVVLTDADENSIKITNGIHTSKLISLFSDNSVHLKTVDILNDVFPLNFCYYDAVLHNANILYDSVSFFNEPLKSPFNKDTWQQSNQLYGTQDNSNDFSSTIKISHTGLYNRDRALICSLAIAKIQLPSGEQVLLPVIEFSFPVDDDQQNRTIISASKEYDFLFKIQNGRFESVDINQCMMNLKKIIMNNMYRKLNTIMSLSGLTLAEFMNMKSEEIEQFILLFKMVSI